MRDKQAVEAQEKCAGQSSPEVAVVPTSPLKDDIAMAQIYNKKDLFEQAKKAIKDNNLFFFSDVIAFLPCHGDTFYQYFRPDEDEHTELREMLEDNKIRTKSSIRAKLFKSQKAAELLALYRLICTPEEHRLLNQQYIESKVDAKVTGFNVKDVVKFDRKRREEEED